MELPGDALAFLEDCPPGSFFAFPFHEPGPLCQVVRIELANARRIADEPRHEQDQVRLDQALEGVGTALADEEDGHDRGRQCREAQRCQPVEAFANCVGGDEDPQPDLVRRSLRDDGDVDDGCGEHHEHHDQRIAAAPHEGEAFEEQQDDGQAAGGRQVCRSREEGQE